ncbi:MAG: hypothetical protein QW648_01700 [Nanoarchaeales archaeon]
MLDKKFIIIIVIFVTFSLVYLNLFTTSTGFFLLIKNDNKKILNEEINSNLNYFQDLKTIVFSDLDPIFCGINFNPPWFVVYNNDGGYLIIISSEGNLFINTTSNLIITSSVRQTGWLNAFILRNSSHILFAANRTHAQIYGRFVENVNPIPTTNSFVVRNLSNNIVLAIFNSSDGRFYLRGKAVYTGSQAGCPSDGWYCSGDIREYRDYYCYAPSGSCGYTVTQSENCNNYDGCYNYGNNAGCGSDPTAEKRDYYCSNGACVYTYSSVNCDRYDICTNVCGGDNKIYSYKDYYVSSSCTCTYSLGSLVEDCTTKASTDTDGGDNPFIQGTVTDYIGCSGTSSTCNVYNTYTDYCSSSTTLVEYYPIGSSYGSKTYDCSAFWTCDICYWQQGLRYACYACIAGKCVGGCSNSPVSGYTCINCVI